MLRYIIIIFAMSTQYDIVLSQVNDRSAAVSDYYK